MEIPHYNLEELLNKIAKNFSKKVVYGGVKTDDGFSYKIFNREQLIKYKPFKNLLFDYLIVKTKDGEATKRAYYVGTFGSSKGKISQVDACLYQARCSKRFNLIQKLVLQRGEK